MFNEGIHLGTKAVIEKFYGKLIWLATDFKAARGAEMRLIKYPKIASELTRIVALFA